MFGAGAGLGRQAREQVAHRAERAREHPHLGKQIGLFFGRERVDEVQRGRRVAVVEGDPEVVGWGNGHAVVVAQAVDVCARTAIESSSVVVESGGRVRQSRVAGAWGVVHHPAP